MSSFKQAFAKARKEKGAGKTFTWNGKSYSTNYAEESKKSRSKGSPQASSKRPKARSSKNIEDMARKAIDRAPNSKKASPKGGKSRAEAYKKTTPSNPKAKVTSSKLAKKTKDNRPNLDLSRDNLKNIGDYMDNKVRPKIRRILGIGASMKPQQKTTKGSRNRKDR